MMTSLLTLQGIRRLECVGPIVIRDRRKPGCLQLLQVLLHTISQLPSSLTQHHTL